MEQVVYDHLTNCIMQLLYEQILSLFTKVEMISCDLHDMSLIRQQQPNLYTGSQLRKRQS